MSVLAKRNRSVDLVRLIACYGVIALHVKSDTEVSNWLNIFFWPVCVPFFYVASLTYFIAGIKNVTINKIASRMCWRIGLPYLAWSIIYISLFFLKKITLGVNHTFPFIKVLFYGESAVQLYYLPMLLSFQCLALALYLCFNSTIKIRIWALGGIVGILFYFYWGIINNCFGVSSPGSLIGIAAYILSAFYFSSKVYVLKIRWPLVAIGFLLLATGVVSNGMGNTFSAFGYPLVLPMCGIGVFMITIGYPIYSIPGWVSNLCAASFGIYLCHDLFLQILTVVLKKMNYSIYYNLPVKVLVVSVLFILSALVVSLLRKFELTKVTLLGEKK